MKITEFKLQKIIKKIITESEIYKFDSNTPPNIRYDIAVKDCAKEYSVNSEVVEPFNKLNCLNPGTPSR